MELKEQRDREYEMLDEEERSQLIAERQMHLDKRYAAARRKVGLCSSCMLSALLELSTPKDLSNQYFVYRFLSNCRG